ncbi:MAG TPA: sugar transferase [Streptosporangiaceae bacterium]|nr:sugar transferase [Streptosporangiaceae bacterium]
MLTSYAAGRDHHVRLSYSLVKRGIDIVLATILLLVTLPLLLVACVAIALDSPGSCIYRQWRMGVGERPFKIIKLRTMVTYADRLGPELTQDADPRITRVGSVLRRWSVDEFPQLLNVLAGHMSLVGPRPELVSIAETYTDSQRRVLQVRPGLTGWAQVNGRDDLSIHAKLELELEYVVNRTNMRDLAIMARTVSVVLSGEGTKR